MTLQQVMDFLAVAEHGSLHAAARATGQAQPALTKSLARLERDLGAPLFDRSSRGMQQNAYGRRFQLHAKRLVAEAGRARDAVAQLRGERLGRVEFGVSAAASLLLAPAAIERFRRSHPAVELRSRGGLYHVLAGPVREGQIDFAICPRPAGPPDTQLAVRTVMESQMVMVARREHPMVRVRKLESVREATFAVAAPPGLPGGGVYEIFERHGWGAPRIALVSDGLIETAALVAGSDCLALLPAALLHTGMLRERLAPLPLPANELPRYTLGLFQRAGVPLTPAAQTLADLFLREAAALKAA